MKPVCIVQARMGSVRLPGKVLLPLGGRTVLWHVLTACKQIPGIHRVVCASPDEPATDAIEAEATKLNVGTFRGSELDVLDRYYQCATALKVEAIMRITADCPLIDPNVCWKVLRLFDKCRMGKHGLSDVDYCSNVMPRQYPKGLDCEVFTYAALQLAHRNAMDDYDSEHVTPWIQRNMRCLNLPGPGTSHLSVTLDTPEDYAKLQRAFAMKRAA